MKQIQPLYFLRILLLAISFLASGIAVDLVYQGSQMGIHKETTSKSSIRQIDQLIYLITTDSVRGRGALGLFILSGLSLNALALTFLEKSQNNIY